MFSLYFFFRDFVLDFFRRLGITRERFLIIAVMIGLVLQILGLIAFLKVRAHQPVRFFIGEALDWVIHNHPFRGHYGPLRFAGVAFAAAMLSVWSYHRKRSYLG